MRLHERYQRDAGEVAFNRCVIQPAKRTVLIDGQPAAIGARAFDLLLALVERRDRLVSKNELHDLVWPGRFVEENNLQVQIWALRKLLGRAAIATIPGYGYRFAASIVGAAQDETTLAPPAAPPSQPGPPAGSTQLIPAKGHEGDLECIVPVSTRAPCNLSAVVRRRTQDS